MNPIVAKWLAVGLFLILVAFAGATGSYFFFVPSLKDQVTSAKAAVAQKDADLSAMFAEQLKERQYVANQTHTWYVDAIRRIKHDNAGVLVRAASGVSAATVADSVQGIDGAVGQLRPDAGGTANLDTIFYQGKSVADRLVFCKKDAIALTAFQSLTNRSNLPIQ
jgi:hypothetical protein